MTKDIRLRVLTVVIDAVSKQITASPTADLCNALHTLLVDYQEAFQLNNVSLLKRVDERVGVLEAKIKVHEALQQKRGPVEGPKSLMARMG